MDANHHGHGGQFVPKKVPIRRPRKACTICRGLKTRCLPDGENKDPKSRCSRCARLNLVCEYSRARRGRKNSDNEHNSPPSGSSLNGSHMQHRLSIDSGMPIQRNKWDMMSSYDNSPADGRMLISGMLDNKGVNWSQPRGSIFSVNGEVHSPDMYPASNGSDHPSPLTTYGLLPGKNPATFIDYLNPPLQIIDGPQASFHGRAAEEAADPMSPDPFSSVYSTPVEAGFMTDAEARQLFTTFMSRIAPSSTMFDPHYHTLERVRQHPVLLTAILSAAALFLRPELAEQLRRLADSYISRKMNSGHYDLALVQAILVLVYWKHPNDRTTYQKMGNAVRLVHELRLQRITEPNRSVKGATTDEEERRRVDIERTVHWCFGHDIAVSFALQLPPAQNSPMPSADQVMAWAESHRHLNVPGDFFSAFNAGLWETHSSFGGHPRFLIEGTPLKYTADGYAVVTRRLEQHLARFRNHPMLMQEPYAGLCQLMGDSAVLKVRTLGWLQNLCPTTTSTSLINLCEDFLGVIKRTQDILFCSDMIVSQVSVPGILLTLARKNFTQDERRRCSAIMLQIADVAQVLSTRAGGEHTLPLVERFYRRLAQEYDRRSDGGEVSPTATFAHYQWPGLSTEFAPSMPPLAPPSDTMDPAPEWAWSSVLNTMPAWEGGIVP